MCWEKKFPRKIFEKSFKIKGDTMTWKNIVKENGKHWTDKYDEIERIQNNMEELIMLTDTLQIKYRRSIEEERERMAENIEKLDDYISSVLVKISKLNGE